MQQESVRGSQIERVASFLRCHFNAVAYRGLARTAMARLPLRNNRFQGFAADTLWLLEVAITGPLIRVPVVGYRKRVHETSVVAGWKRWSLERVLEAWAGHCAACAEAVLAGPWPSSDRQELLKAIDDRLLQRQAELWQEAKPTDTSTSAAGWAAALRERLEFALEGALEGAET